MTARAKTWAHAAQGLASTFESTAVEASTTCLKGDERQELDRVLPFRNRDGLAAEIAGGTCAYGLHMIELRGTT